MRPLVLDPEWVLDRVPVGLQINAAQDWVWICRLVLPRGNGRGRASAGILQGVDLMGLAPTRAAKHTRVVQTASLDQGSFTKTEVKTSSSGLFGLGFMIMELTSRN